MAEASHALTWETEDGVTVVRFRMNSITDGQYLDQAWADLESLAGRAGGKVLFSLANVEAISSRALAALVWFHQAVQERRGQFKICEVAPFVWRALHLTRLDETFEIYGSKAEAVAAFQCSSEQSSGPSLEKRTH